MLTNNARNHTVFVAHLGDEVLECGATVNRLVAIGPKAFGVSRDLSRRIAYKKVKWHDWPDALVERAKVCPYA